MTRETQPISRPLVALPALWGQQLHQHLLGFLLTEFGQRVPRWRWSRDFRLRPAPLTSEDFQDPTVDLEIQVLLQTGLGPCLGLWELPASAQALAQEQGWDRRARWQRHWLLPGRE